MNQLLLQRLSVFKTTLLLVMLWLAGCTGIPDGIEPVENFDLDRYLGRWYEIARLDHSFERGLSNVTATYEPRSDGGVRVLNSGYSSEDQTWEQAEGKAYFVEEETTGYLKVSFFGPFYGSYVVFELDPDYEYAFVTGPNKKYLWLLSRTPEVSEQLRQRFLTSARSNGYAVDELIFVDQSFRTEQPSGVEQSSLIEEY